MHLAAGDVAISQDDEQVPVCTVDWPSSHISHHDIWCTVQTNKQWTFLCTNTNSEVNNNNNRRLVTLAEHTSDHGRQTNSSTEEKGEQV